MKTGRKGTYRLSIKTYVVNNTLYKYSQIKLVMKGRSLLYFSKIYEVTIRAEFFRAGFELRDLFRYSNRNIRLEKNYVIN